MIDLFKLILGVLASLFRSRAQLEAEILVRRQQINVLRRRPPSMDPTASPAPDIGRNQIAFYALKLDRRSGQSRKSLPSTPVRGWRACFGNSTNRRCPMKALAISMVVGAALCSLISVPALAMPMSNLAAAASDLALGQSVRYVHHHYRYPLGRSSYYAYV